MGEPKRELMHRRDGGLDVTMYYHGKDADPKITVEVLDFTAGTMFTIKPAEERAMDAYLHPFAFSGQTAEVLVATAIP